MNNNSGSTGGVGFAGLLALAFIVLKMCDVIKWPWIWVLSPLWISTVALIVIVVVLFILKKLLD